MNQNNKLAIEFYGHPFNSLYWEKRAWTDAKGDVRVFVHPRGTFRVEAALLHKHFKKRQSYLADIRKHGGGKDASFTAVKHVSMEQLLRDAEREIEEALAVYNNIWDPTKPDTYAVVEDSVPLCQDFDDVATAKAEQIVDFYQTYFFFEQ